MNSLRLRFLLPLVLFGFLPAMGAARLMGHSLDWFFGTQGVLLGGGVFLAAYLLSGWVLKPVAAMMNATASLMRGIPPTKDVAEWLPADFWKLRCDVNMLFAKHRQALSTAETHSCQTAQRLANAERLLRDAFTALQGIFSASDEGVAVVDGNGTIIASNARLDEFLGSPLDENGGRDFETLAGLLAARFQDSGKVAGWIRECLEEPAFKGSLEAGMDGGTIMELRTAPMLGDSGEVLGRLWLLRDRTELSGLRQQLRESQKLGTLGQLAGGIAHDFNNMLTTIRGNLTLAEISPGGDVKDKIKTATHATQRAADLVKQLLSYSRRSGGASARRVTNVKKLLADVENMLKHSVDPRVSIRVRAGMDASFVMADAAQLEQVVLNLCINARDSLPAENGVIEIGIENITQRAPDGVSGPAEFTVITVRDNGRGIPESVRPHIFEPFFTTKQDGKGTGLGLSMAQDIIREHGGWIEFDSAEGQGSVFRIHLPRTSDPENVDDDLHADALIPAQSLESGRGTILVVDDEESVRATAVNMLKYLGYQILEAADGQQALDVLLHSGRQVDAVMLDIYMPVLSGRDAFKQMREAGNDTPVVICSGFVMDPDEFVILGQGHPPPVEIMLKPYSLDALGKAMAKAVQSGREAAPPAGRSAARIPFFQH